MNNAIIATLPTLTQFTADMTAYAAGNPTVNENKWIFLSPEGSNGVHGMVWTFFYGAMRMGGLSSSAASAAATTIANEYPNGAFFNYNFYR